MTDTVFKSSSLPETTEAIVDCVPPESAENPIETAALVVHVNQPSGEDTPLELTGEQSIRTADELHKTLAEYLDRSLAVVVDLSEVDECDTAALQLIYALRQSAVQRKQPFHITAVSPAITETTAALGLRIEELMTPCGPAVPDSDGEAASEDSGI